MTALGYAIHIAIHQKWAGRFYRSHLNHHTIQYPPDNYLSETYRDAGKDNTVISFTLCFIPVVIAILLLGCFGIIPLFLSLFMIGEMLVVGFLNDHFHDHTHLINSRYNKYSWFQKLRQLHLIHHIDMSKNFGIFMFVWDKLFGTYVD